MLTNGEIDEGRRNPWRSVAEAAWALQANHERFLFKKGRAHDDPSRLAWWNANNLWQAQVRARRAGRLAVI